MSWGNKDQANSSPVWTGALVNKAPTRTVADSLFEGANTSVVPGVTVDVVGITVAEIQGEDTTFLLKGAAVANAGTNAVPGNVYAISNTGATQSAPATVKAVTTKVTTAAVAASNTGTGYANGDIVIFDGVDDAILTITTGAANTSIASVVITAPGKFTTNPTLANTEASSTSGSGTGARFNLQMGLDTVEVAAGGTFTVVPTAVANNALSGNSLTGATVDLTFGKTPGSSGDGIAQTGWVLKKTFSGGRAGRVQQEVLVVGKMNG